MSTVWILGSGFSRPLGGPVLKDLLSEASFDRLGCQYARLGSIDSDGGKALRLVYREWCHLQKSPDAEAFLDYLDSAESVSAAEAYIQTLLEKAERPRLTALDRPPVAEIICAAKRMIAAECSAFLDEVNLDSEKWEPYCRWVSNLADDDTIITFNYDRVPDLLAQKRNGGIVIRHSGNLTEEHAVPIVLKLHGSVDWKIVGKGKAARCLAQDDPLFALSCDHEEIGIATPGRSKIVMTDAAFDGLWSLAAKAIQDSQEIVFIGYRFPPTDARALRTLLGAIEKNQSSNHLRLHIVLGPVDPDGDIIRLESLLRYTAENAGRREQGKAEYAEKYYSIRRHPLWAQDFLAVFNRRML